MGGHCEEAMLVLSQAEVRDAMNATIPATEKPSPKSSEEPPVVASEADAQRAEALASLKRKRRFGEDVIAYLTVNGVLWLIWALTDRSTDGGMPWPAWVSAVWGFFLAMDAWRAYGSWPRSLRRPTPCRRPRSCR